MYFLNLILAITLLIGSSEMNAKSEKLKLHITHEKTKDNNYVKFEVENTSEQIINIFDDSNMFNHSKLLIIKDNKEVEFANLLSVASLDIRQTYNRLTALKSIPPKEKLLINKAIIERNNDSFSIKWGPYIYMELVGELKLHIQMSMDSQKYYDFNSGVWKVDKSILTGNFESNKIIVNL